MPTGKTGADAIAQALKHICRILVKYQAKLQALIADLVTDGTLTAPQAATANDFINLATSACAVFVVIAEHSGF